MLSNYVKIGLRNLWRNWLFTGINVVNLAVGIAAITLVFLIVDLLFVNFDRFHANTDRLYVLQQESPDMRLNSASVAPALPALLREYPAIETGTRLLFRETNWFSALPLTTGTHRWPFWLFRLEKTYMAKSHCRTTCAKGSRC